jgi:hypothetical protein
MKWSFVIQQKFKAAILLGGIMVMIICGTLLSRYNMQGMDESFSSIYRDRLIPATTIIYLTENLYGKRLKLEKFLFSQESKSPGNTAQAKSALRAHDKSIDSLISIFEKTYLVDEEAKSLQTFKKQITSYASLEKQIITLCDAGSAETGRALFAGQAAKNFDATITNLNELAGIQSSIGQDLVNESRVNVASFGIISFLQIALAIITGLVILVLIRNSQIIKKPRVSGNKSQYFNLN